VKFPRSASESKKVNMFGGTKRRGIGLGVAGALVAAGIAVVATNGAGPSGAATLPDNSANTTTPIKHVVVLFDENVSFDHYFATYPYAANTDGTPFKAAPDTPTDIDTELNAGLIPGSQLKAHNPNSSLDPTDLAYTQPNPNAYQPQRLASSQAVTCDQNHSYGPEQSAADAGSMDKFVESTNQTCSTTGTYSSPGLVMSYYDGNTVTGLWNYAQHYAMSDNNWDTVFGPSTPGALNLISGNTYSGSSMINGDVDPNGDSFGSNSGSTTPTMQGANVGDLLNAKGVSWGWFQGGFANKSASSPNAAGAMSSDYSSHHNPFEYYASTQNKAHTPPASDAEIGFNGAANHEYDLSLFQAALNGTDGAELPAVSFLKAPESQDGHAGYSDPLSEQEFLTSEINAIEQSPDWSSTAIVVTYDDSDGWYDHVAPIITNASSGVSGDTTICTNAATAGVAELGGYAGRCGPSQRLPLVVISPYAKQNYVSHALTNQASILKFIEDNWSTGTIDPVSRVQGSFDASAGSLDDMFDWTHPQRNEVLLDSTEYSGSSTINPDYGAVASTPVSPVVPTPAPVLAVSTHKVSLPRGSALPSEADFLSLVGATIDHGALGVDLSSVNPDASGDYTVTVTGSDTGVPAMDPATITVEIAPSVTLANPTLHVTAGSTAPTPSYVRTMAGAAVADGGTLDLPDLSDVDFSTPGSYQVEITGKAGGITAIPALLTIVVEGSGAPLGRPVVSLAHDTLVYAVGSAPTATKLTGDAGVSISHGTLDPISLAGVDFTKAGSYQVAVTGSDFGEDAVPATLTVEVVAPPTVTLGNPTLVIRQGTPLTSAQVLASTFASISAGTLSPVDLSAVNVAKPGSYRVSITGADRGVAAVPATATIEVQGITPSSPVKVASATALAARPLSVTGKKKVTLTVSVTAKGAAPTGAVAVYDGAKVVATATLAHGTATVTLTGLGVGRHQMHAVYAGSTLVTGSTSHPVTVKVVKKKAGKKGKKGKAGKKGGPKKSGKGKKAGKK
jgi:phospholipase C